MAHTIDREVLTGFLEEARGYLPHILEGVAEFQADPSRLEVGEIARVMDHARLVGIDVADAERVPGRRARRPRQLEAGQPAAVRP